MFRWLGLLMLYLWSPMLSPAIGNYSVDTSRHYTKMLEEHVFSCIAGKRVRVYFNSVDWVEVKCTITDDNLWIRRSFRNVTTGEVK